MFRVRNVIYKILKYGLPLLAILLIGIWIFRHYQFSEAISWIIIFGKIAEHPELLIGIAAGIIIGVILWRWPYQKPMKINLPGIDKTLKRKMIKDTSYIDFLKERKDPYWIDFEKGYIAKRKEVDTIITKLEQNKLHMIIGPPASGKSIIAKNIGYEFRSKKKYDVYIIELKIEDLDVKDIVEEISKVRKKNTLLIIDDVHLGLTEDVKLNCNELLRRIEGPKIKILLSSRDVIERKVEPRAETELEILRKDKNTCTKINSFDIVENILTNFENKRNMKIKEEHKKEMKKEFGNDLWTLSLALSLYDSAFGIPDKEKLHGEIKNLLTMGRLEELHADDIILPISLWYSYETPIAMRILTEDLGINEEYIRKLVDLGEIRERDKILSLYHSSRAILYLETFRAYKNLGKHVKENIHNKFGDWYIGLFHLYFQSKPKKCVSLLSRLSRDYNGGIIKEDIVIELIKNDKTKNAIFERIVETMVIKNVNSLHHPINYIANTFFSEEFLQYFTEEDHLNFLTNSKLNQIGSFLNWGGYYHSINVQNTYSRFSKEFLLRKMNEATLEEIRVFIRQLAQVKSKKDASIGKKLALNAIGELREVDNLFQKFEDAKLETVRHLIKNINDINDDPIFIIDEIKPPFDLIPKLEESSLNDINMLIMSIDKVNIAMNETELNLKFIIDQIKQINQNKLIKKLEESPLKSINHFIINIKRHDIEDSNYIFGLIKESDLTGKLKESNMSDLSWFIWNISNDVSLSTKYSKIISDIDVVEIIEKSDLDSVNHFMENIFRINNNIPEILTNDIVRNILINYLNKDNENIGDKFHLIGIFEWAECSLLEKDNKFHKTEISIFDLKKWFKKCLNPINPHPIKIALALKGFKAINEKNMISFIHSHLDLKEIIYILKKSEIKNRKTEQLIENMLTLLNDL